MGNGAGGQIDLTTREREILLLLAEGNSDKEVANRLGLSVTQLRHITRDFQRKFGARSRAQVIAKAVVEGILVICPDGETLILPD